MNLMKRSWLAAAVCLVSASFAQAAPPAGCGTLNAGYQILSLPSAPGGSHDTLHPNTLTVALWYPTNAATTSYSYWDSIISGQVAVNAPVTDCGNGTKFPLVFFSHGYSGCGIQTVFLTEELARQGYIVAAPDHEDHGCTTGSQTAKGLSVAAFNPAAFGDAATWTYQTAFYRSVDVDYIINWLQTNSPWRDRIDANRMGMTGHSFGGYTAFAKVGGWPQWLPKNYSFKAAIMMSPYIQAFTYNNAVQNPTVPMMFQGGALDIGETPSMKQGNAQIPGAYQSAQFPPNGSKYFLELDAFPGSGDSSHFAWVNTVCGLNGNTVQGCLNPTTGVPNARFIVNYTLAFLDRYVAGQPTGAELNLLASTGAGLKTYWRTSGVPGGTYTTGSPSAPKSIAAIKGDALAPTHNVVANGSLSMPSSLNGVTVWVYGLQATLYGIDPAQINFVVPDGLPSGYYTVTAKDSSGNVIATGPISVNRVSPAFFTALPGPDPKNLSVGWAWGWTQQGYISDPGVCQTISGVVYCGVGAGVPVGVAQGNTYLVLAANGIRGASDLQATVNGIPVPVVGVASPSYEGIDQVNIGPVPASLAGRGVVNVVLTAGGMQSNAAAVMIR